VFRSDNGGASWVNCTAGLPNIPMNAVVVDPGNYKRIWVAADVGVYETLNLGSSWASFSNGLPNALAADLLFHKQDRMLICATYLALSPASWWGFSCRSLCLWPGATMVFCTRISEFSSPTGPLNS
jgi:hypothetical protein